ncbi:hypothetical protein [Streptomyces rochei]|uniref:hypothetical protein n=1 Tax=Streptomyces rochei TaxID=1928 RepID=UPI0036A9011E
MKETAVLITPDPATPEGAAVIDLAALMDALQARTGEWPGAETTAILSDWLRRFSFAAPTAHTTQRAGRAWVLRRWDRRCEEVTLWSDEASALASLAQHVRTHWDNVAGTDGVPHRPPPTTGQLSTPTTARKTNGATRTTRCAPTTSSATGTRPAP